MHLCAAHMAVGDRLLKLVRGKIPRAHAGIKHAAAQIDRVRAVLHGGTQRFHRAGRRQQFNHKNPSFCQDQTAPQRRSKKFDSVYCITDAPQRKEYNPN